MTTGLRQETVRSPDGTMIGYHSTGHGPGLVVVGGALSSGGDYAELASLLATSFEVHLLDRRGRGLSGPQGPGYSIDTECDDLEAVAKATGSVAVLGHSFGGLIALEVARRSRTFEHVVVYEPGVPLDGSIRFGWLDRYQQLLDQGDRRGAFASMVKGAGLAPAPLAVMPLWYVRAVLRLVIRGERWRSIAPLLEANLAEHRLLEQMAPSLRVGRYSSIASHVVLLGGSKSPDFAGRTLIRKLASVIPHADAEIIDGLNHLAPEEQATPVARVVHRYLRNV